MQNGADAVLMPRAGPYFFISLPKLLCYPDGIVRSLYLILGLLLCGLVTGHCRADTFKLTNGETLVGEVFPVSANDQGVQVKVGDGQYQRVPWASFSQEDLKKFAKEAKMEAFVQPFIEINPEEKVKKTEVHLKEPSRLERPAKQSLFGAMFSSSLGFVLVLLVYAANIYAGYEVAIFRAQPPALVCGLAAIPGLGVLATIAFLSMPTKVKPTDGVPAPAEAPAPVAGSEEELNPMHANGAQHPTGLKLAHSEPDQAKSVVPETEVYQRGEYTFNRRFIETKFAGFFGVVRRDAEKDKVLVIKSGRGEYKGQRISRIAANDLHLQVQRGHASEEVLIPFQDIQEIRVKHKDA
jgi:hypothetical protein